MPLSYRSPASSSTFCSNSRRTYSVALFCFLNLLFSSLYRRSCIVTAWLISSRCSSSLRIQQRWKKVVELAVRRMPPPSPPPPPPPIPIASETSPFRGSMSKASASHCDFFLAYITCYMLERFSPSLMLLCAAQSERGSGRKVRGLRFRRPG